MKSMWKPAMEDRYYLETCRPFWAEKAAAQKSGLNRGFLCKARRTGEGQGEGRFTPFTCAFRSFDQRVIGPRLGNPPIATATPQLHLTCPR